MLSMWMSTGMLSIGMSAGVSSMGWVCLRTECLVMGPEGQLSMGKSAFN